MANPRVLLGFSSMSDHDIEETAGAVIAGLYAQTTIYSHPPFPIDVLQGKLTAFTDAIAAQAQGGTAATAAKNAACTDLIGSLRLLALYVQQVIDGNPDYGLAELLLSGFEAVSSSRAQQPLDQPTITGIDNDGAGLLGVHVRAVRNAGAYELQGKADGDAAFRTFGLFRSTRGMQATGLTPGVNYTFQVRAVGGSTEYSQWSDPVSHRSL